MRELGGRQVKHRVKGRPVLERRLRALLIAAHRFARCRATTLDDPRWSAKVIDGLTATLEGLMAGQDKRVLDGTGDGGFDCGERERFEAKADTSPAGISGQREE